MYSDGNTPATNMLNAGFTANEGWMWSNEFQGNPGGCIASTSWFEPAGTASRWIITPAIAIPDSGFIFSVDCMAQDPSYPDGFKILVSTDDDSQGSFTVVMSQASASPRPNYQTYTVSLDAFAGDTIHVALVNNTEDKFILLADNFQIYRPNNEGAFLQGVSTPAYASTNTPININITVKGDGITPITSLKAKYVVNNADTSAEMDITGLNIAYGATSTFALPVSPSFANAGNYAFSVLLYALNGNDSLDIAGSGNYASNTFVYDPATVTTRTSILEQFTGSQCGYCPGGHDRIAEALQSNSDVIWLVHHAGFNQDALSNANSTALTWYFNDGGRTFAPALMVNRTHLYAEAPGPVIGVGSVNEIKDVINTAKTVPCFVNIDASGVSFDMNTRKVSGNITGNFTAPVYGPNTRINVYILEDTLYMDQTDYSTGSSRVIRNYMHNKTCRGAITGDWGETLTPANDGTFSFAVDYTLPQNIKSWRTRLVIVVNNYDANDANNSMVLNSTQTANFPGTYVGIDEVGSNVTLTVFPNPANNFVNVEANENIRSIRVVNTLGQTVYNDGNVNAETIQLNTADYANGIYILTVTTDNGTSTKRISVSR